ncbi:5-(carboxyamino)imidazole ribonucleotide synthase [Shewanella algae]|uniref:5-(carboxyamino)imidazole ribonucleotide synthase n=1 Tax=Shewanella algae TaxID=38313 RepID=UPI001183074F|nr:5-(carboxyamino)imidazole ribonucleotide synthase [Shewanella algae]MBO2570226.1 5-(carboxyamino)imidazole ribonucleotide synthase [Shewanella algae]MBO2692856.1 5-(carboxyamino)imidazole ribonucleotide synthase [Shewanella algae]MBO2697149.1 5-(carboxyamino)imidazole ribonucleotide synthase [Shewanella algae]TVL17051.1 5-(carboxyamino)imidazole ribonucleotide synthase [Shewanella algae]BCV54596.1 N5-carboxyaminoimidazole ribonucleotide synthase [Shewanella algae]
MADKRVWVLGDGQLGAMLRHAGQPLAIDVRPVDIMAPSDEKLPLTDTDIITAEREQWPESPLSLQLSQHRHFINGPVFGRLADRYTQKSLLDQLKVATAPWELLDDNTQANDLYHKYGERVLLKRRTGGYDGKGQHWLKQAESTSIPADWRNQAIAEQAIPFDEEVSLVGVRSRSGECFFYPLTLNLHQDGILMASVAPLARLQPLQAEAETMLCSIMHELEYVGVMAMECFRVGDHLLVNELAPRVHNSGHWTQAGTHMDQFQLHLRALCDLPLMTPQVNFQCVMVNLIGIDKDDRWLSLANAELFWYDKEVRPGRKVGHLNLSVLDKNALADSIARLQQWMPAQYQAPLMWILAEFG